MKNFLFDFDGTLADTLPLCITAFREAIEPLAGRSLSDADIIETFGPSEEGTIAALLPDNESVGMTAYLERYAALHGNWPAPFPGIPELLHYLKEKGAFVGLITGKGPQSAALSLEHYDMGAFFQTVQTGDRSGPVKEQRISHVIEAYNLDPAETLYIGDAPSDITASHACGIRVAAAAWAASADIEALQALGPDYLFTSLEDFYTFIHGLFE